jgi:biogenesis of lysosome-related organelles complex 1 subunit 2
MQTSESSSSSTNLPQPSGSSAAANSLQSSGTMEASTINKPSADGPTSADLRSLSASAVDAVAAYLRTDLESTLDDYALLENMNRAASAKYVAMKDSAKQVESSFRVLNEREQQLAVHFLELQRIEHTLQSIEDVAYRLDAYSKRLETKFKQLLVEKD